MIDELCTLGGGDYKVFALCANSNVDLIEQQARRFKPEFCVVYDETSANDLKIKLKDTSITVLSGMGSMENINFIASHDKTDYVINALMGQIGLEPTLMALRAKKTVGLANKETLVAAGDIVMELARNGANQIDRIFPIDSEHSAIFQCLQGEDLRDVEKLILTASGGPFYGKTKDELKNITVADALCHPTWKMGAKITIDSATMMNKGLELIEACHLFGVSPDDVDIIIHRQSIVHSLVQFIDKSVKAQMGAPDMKMCIQYALTYNNKNNKSGGKREKSRCKELNLTELQNLAFSRPDDEMFIFPELARYALKEGGVLPAVMNSANEAAVELFLKEKISFLDIFEIVYNAVHVWKHKNIKNPEINDIIESVEDIKRQIISKFI